MKKVDKKVLLDDEIKEIEDSELNNTEKIIEKILESYSVFEDIFQRLSDLKAFNSTCVIKIKKIKEIINHKFPFVRFGFLERGLMEDRINCLNGLITKLTPFEKDFVLMRYFEHKTRNYVISALHIGSMSTYKRRRHKVLEHCKELLNSDGNFSYLFMDFLNYIEK